LIKPPFWKSIDIEALNNEIEARPTIWNVLSAEYNKDRIKKKAQLFATLFSARRQRSDLCGLRVKLPPVKGVGRKISREGQRKKRPKIANKDLKIAVLSLFQERERQRKKDRKIAEKYRKLALLSLYPLYICTMYENPGGRCGRPCHLFTTCLSATRRLAVKSCKDKTSKLSGSSNNPFK